MSPEPRGSQRFRPPQRIRRRREFQAVYKEGLRQSGRFMTAFVRSNPDGVCRLGVAATRRIGEAVARNRAKRLIRECFRRNRPGSGLDVVIVVRRELLGAPFSSLEAEFRSLLQRRRPARQRPSGDRP